MFVHRRLRQGPNPPQTYTGDLFADAASCVTHSDWSIQIERCALIGQPLSASEGEGEGGHVGNLGHSIRQRLVWANHAGAVVERK